MNYIKINKNCYFFPEWDRILLGEYNNSDDEILNEIFGKKNNYLLDDPFYNFNRCLSTSYSVFLSNGCSLKCNYCYYSSGDNSNIINLSKNKIDIVISYIVKNALLKKLSGKGKSDIEITFTGGGEPTFNFDILKYFVDLMKKKCEEHMLSVKFILISNGVLSDKVLNFVLNEINYIQISYDGLPELQNKNRRLNNGKDSSEYVHKSFAFFSKKNKDISVRSTILKEDSSKIKDIIDFLFKNFSSIKLLHIEPLQHVGRAENSPERLSDDTFVNNFIDAKKYVIETYPDRELYCSLFDYSVKNIPCTTLTGQTPVINTQGLFFPCSNNLDKSKYCIGEIKDNAIKYYENNGYSKIYKEILKTKCNNCKSFYFCGGGCPSSIIRDKDGNIDKESQSVCSMINHFWDKAFTNLIKEKSFLDIRLVRDKSIQSYDIYKIVKEKNS